MNLTFHWPQVTLIIIWTLRLMLHAVKNGELYDPPGKYNLGATVIGLGVTATILYCGGFFSQP